MFSFFKKDPRKRLQEQYQAKLQEALQAQRNGDMRLYATLSEEAEALLAQIKDLEQAKEPA